MGSIALSQAIQQRIRRRREEFGASIEEAAAWAELPSERWRDIESGDSLSVAELGQLARALAVDPGTLLRGQEGRPRRSVARFRQAADSFPGRRLLETRTLALAAELGRVGGGLYQLLGKPLPLSGIRKTEPVSDREEEWRQGYRLGAAARRSLGIPAGPIPDLQTTLEGRGIHVATLPFSPVVDAASLMEDGAMPIILLNQASPRVEQTLPRRSSMAHELCHLLHDAGELDFETRLSGKESNHDDAVERRARAFAPAFLAPSDEVNLWFRSGDGKRWRDPRRRVVALARRWGLSWGGAIWHAKNCGLIRPLTVERLKVDGEKQAWHLSFEQGQRPSGISLDGIDVSSLCRGRLAEIVLEACESDTISEGRAREILSWG